MVEELIAEGMAPGDIETLLVGQFGMTPGDAQLLISTAQGGPGDVLDVVEDADVVAAMEDDEDLTAAGVFTPALHPRFEKGRREGGRFAPKDGTSTEEAQSQALDQAAAAEEAVNVARPDPMAEARRKERWELIRGNQYELEQLSGAELADYITWANDDVKAAYAKLPDNLFEGEGGLLANPGKEVPALEDYYQRNAHLEAARLVETQRAQDVAYMQKISEQPVQPGEVGRVSRMDLKSTNPVYVGELDGQKVVVKPENQLTATQLRTHVQTGFDLDREQAAAHVAGLIAADAPDVAVPVPAYRQMDVEGYGPSGVSDFVEGKTMAAAYRDAAAKVKGTGEAPVPIGKWGNDLENVRLYDGIIGNTDRHEGNLMIDPAGRIHAIDHGLAFPDVNQESWPNLQGGSSIVPLSDGQRGALERLQTRIGTDAVLPTLLTEQQIKATQERVAFMLDKGRLPVREDWMQGWGNR
jgi:hypothetical protein